jgi:hypothetical protein
MYYDPRFELAIVKRSHQEHQMIAAEHRLARQARGTDEVPTKAATNAATSPSHRGWSTRWLGRLAGHPALPTA